MRCNMASARAARSGESGGPGGSFGGGVEATFIYSLYWRTCEKTSPRTRRQALLAPGEPEEARQIAAADREAAHRHVEREEQQREREQQRPGRGEAGGRRAERRGRQGAGRVERLAA